MSWENEVGRSGKILAVEAKPESKAVRGASYYQLGTRVLGLDL